MHVSLLVGDVGSTKSSWWFSTDADQPLRLGGYNPVMHEKAEGQQLFIALQKAISAKKGLRIYYYGAGVIHQAAAEDIASFLMASFPDSDIQVQSDLQGAALATCGPAPGTVAILGTGSHAAVWNGKEITQQATALGYILGDEGGGCDIGKTLLRAYFYREMPERIGKDILALLPNGRTDLFAQLNQSSAPNQYLAGFARVAADHIDHPWIRECIAGRFQVFIDKHLKPLSPSGPVHVIGSIGYIFASILREALERNGLTAGQILQDPSRQLFEYHLSHG